MSGNRGFYEIKICDHINYVVAHRCHKISLYKGMVYQGHQEGFNKKEKKIRECFKWETVNLGSGFYKEEFSLRNRWHMFEQLLLFLYS